MKKHHFFRFLSNYPLSRLGKACLFGLCVLSLSIPASAADIYGLVIGINDYQTFDTLDGAVNDAQGVFDALNRIGAKQVILLLDKKADRDTIFSKWKSLTSQAKKDDILVFAYAGHGSQEPEHVANSELDGRDENFILADFAPQGRSSYQRIVDDEIDALFRETPDLKILFVADSCHSGTMTRAFATPKKFKKRSVPPPNIQDDALIVLYGKSRGEKNVSANPSKEGGTDSEVATNVFSFSGVSDDEEVTEYPDPDTKKSGGALSMAFAKVLRFVATNNEQGVSKERLQHLITENVRMITEGRQALQVAGSIDFSIPINAKLSPTNTTDTKPSTDDKVAPVVPTQQSINFTVFVDNVPEAVAENQWRPILGQAKTTNDRQTANAIWDIGREKIFSLLGDLVYDGRQPKVQETRAFSRAQSKTPAPAGSVEIAYATKVFNKLIAVERIKKRSETVSPTMVLKPNDRLHRAGEQVTLETSNQQYPYLTLFNIASDGTINNLYPLKEGNINDPLEVPVDKPYGLLLNVEPPYGSDHFVVIFSEKPLTGLHKDLQGMNGGQNANQIEVALDRHLQGIKHQIGIHGVFTGS
jgi:hypothetical protein